MSIRDTVNTDVSLHDALQANVKAKLNQQIHTIALLKQGIVYMYEGHSVIFVPSLLKQEVQH